MRTYFFDSKPLLKAFIAKESISARLALHWNFSRKEKFCTNHAGCNILKAFYFFNVSYQLIIFKVRNA